MFSSLSEGVLDSAVMPVPQRFPHLHSLSCTAFAQSCEGCGALTDLHDGFCPGCAVLSAGLMMQPTSDTLLYLHKRICVSDTQTLVSAASN